MLQKFSTHDVADLSGEWMLGVSNRALRRLIGYKYVRETLQKYREAKAKKEEFDISELITAVAGRLREELKRELLLYAVKQKSYQNSRRYLR